MRGYKIRPKHTFLKQDGKYYLFLGVSRYSSTKLRHIIIAYIKYKLGFKEWWK